MSKSVLYAVNTTTQTSTVVGTVINFGALVRRYGCNLNLSGGNVVIYGSGYYDIDTNFSVTPTTAGTLVVTLYKDGVAIPGATATISAVADTAVAISIPAIIRDTCGCESTLTAVISGVEATVNNAAIDVIKL